MAHSLTDFKSRLIGGGARPNLFEVEITPGVCLMGSLRWMETLLNTCVKQQTCLLQT